MLSAGREAWLIKGDTYQRSILSVITTASGFTNGGSGGRHPTLGVPTWSPSISRRRGST